MNRRIFVAGATGAIGRRLVPLLVKAGDRVLAISRSDERARAAREQGAEIVVADIFDRSAVVSALASFRPDIVMHQLTDLSGLSDPATVADALRRNARIRAEGTRNLVDAALAANVGHLIAQSIAWVYAPGPTPHAESDPLDTNAEEPRLTTIRGVVALEDAVLHSPPIKGAVLRYGQLYGPGTGRDAPASTATMPLHVDAAAYAALLAIEHAASGIFNVAEPNAEIRTDRARSELKWRDDMRC